MRGGQALASAPMTRRRVCENVSRGSRRERDEGELGLTVGIVLALTCAVVTQLGFLCKHRGANRAPEVNLRHPLRTAGALFRSSWFSIGMAVGAGALALHVVALAAAPLSLVQAVLSTGVVVLAVLCDRF